MCIVCDIQEKMGTFNGLKFLSNNMLEIHYVSNGFFTFSTTI